jgi:class 3 adenylate cyclase
VDTLVLDELSMVDGALMEALVEALDHCFSQFDTIIGRYRIEKIKTVGDAYICASGLSDRNEHPSEMIKAAKEMQAFLNQFELQMQGNSIRFNARIGIHFGPVVAGVVGTKKFAYDIWGDTVNTAARMEEASSPGRINVSGSVQAICADAFSWEYRGKIATKNKSELEMYYLSVEVGA